MLFIYLSVLAFRNLNMNKNQNFHIYVITLRSLIKGKFTIPIEGRAHIKPPISYEENRKVLAEERKHEYALYQEKVHSTTRLHSSVQDLHRVPFSSLAIPLEV